MFHYTIQTICNRYVYSDNNIRKLPKLDDRVVDRAFYNIFYQIYELAIILLKFNNYSYS